MTRNIRLGLIGFGRWGKNYFRTIESVPLVSIDKISTKNSNPELCSSWKGAHTNDWKSVISDSKLDGVIICSPPDTHFEMASFALKNRMPVLIEKPITMNFEDAYELASLSKQNKTLCMVDYIHIYSEAYQKLKQATALLGEIHTVVTEGLSIGPFREDVPVIWDWGSHDISMCVDLIGSDLEIISVSRVKHEKIHNNSEIISVTLKSPTCASISCTFGNASSFKSTKFNVNCELGSLSYDGIQHKLDITSNEGSLLYSYVANKTPLLCLVEIFTSSIASRSFSHPSLKLSCDVTKVVERIFNRIHI
jgi:predicted dehydrogenase